MEARKNVSAFLPVVVALVLISTASATTYIVGDDKGWTDTEGDDFYTNWAAKHNFVVGDILEFQFDSIWHTVQSATKSDFDACISVGDGFTVFFSAYNFTIPSAGQYYFICTIGSHCLNGQKLAITASCTDTGAPCPPRGGATVVAM